MRHIPNKGPDFRLVRLAGAQALDRQQHLLHEVGGGVRTRSAAIETHAYAMRRRSSAPPRRPAATRGGDAPREDGVAASKTGCIVHASSIPPRETRQHSRR
jgi:hypothetical protein